ncbi:hypothetical protein PSY76_23500, partial [Shigella flexneri]|nr:hypothetical protein [Shigella flexneri]
AQPKKKIIIKNKVVPTVAQQDGGVLGAGLIPSPAQWVTDQSDKISRDQHILFKQSKYQYH